MSIDETGRQRFPAQVYDLFSFFFELRAQGKDPLIFNQKIAEKSICSAPVIDLGVFEQNAHNLYQLHSKYFKFSKQLYRIPSFLASGFSTLRGLTNLIIRKRTYILSKPRIYVRFYMVRVGRLELPASCSQSTRATNCATPGQPGYYSASPALLQAENYFALVTRTRSTLRPSMDKIVILWSPYSNDSPSSGKRPWKDSIHQPPKVSLSASKSSS